MKNGILKICERLRGYSCDEEYFEVIDAQRNESEKGEIYIVTVRAVEKQGAGDENN